MHVVLNYKETQGTVKGEAGAFQRPPSFESLEYLLTTASLKESS